MLSKTRIRKKVDNKDFMVRMKCYAPESIICSVHTFFRLSEKQREVFTCESIREYLREKVPSLAGEQYNGNCAAFYKLKNKRFIRIIVDIKPNGVNVVTFYVIEKLPVMK